MSLGALINFVYPEGNDQVEFKIYLVNFKFGKCKLQTTAHILVVMFKSALLLMKSVLKFANH